MAPFTPLFIDGQQVPASDNGTFNVYNISTSTVVGISASASSADCTAAVEAAGRAFKTWEKTTPYARRDIFLKAADLASSAGWRDLIIQATMEEMNSSLAWAAGQHMEAAPLIRTIASFANDLTGKTFMSSSVPGLQCVMEQRAMGVIFGIAPWNAPFGLTLRALATPIMCGNTVVIKSSEYSPRTQALAVQLFHEAGLPNGVVNYISMSRESSPALTAQIIAHPLVRKINFTGSDRVGRIIATEAAKHLKPTVLELGGKAPAVVLDDASIPDAAKAIVFGAMLYSGQICMSTERVIVQRKAAEPLIAQIKSLTASLTATDMQGESSKNAKLGPLFTEGSAENVIAMLTEAQAAGTELLLGDLARQGAVVQPHLVKDVKPGMRLWDRESFGPVIAFAVVDTPEEAVELANASEYSLSASLWTCDMYLAQRIAPLIRAGYTNINGPTVHAEHIVSIAGLGGSSGYGHFGIDDFTDKRVVATHPLGRQFPFLQ
ncbi:Aldehyde/histidinol dehydrogenase [Mycena alexandri]|uniref:Aldehyde/histidinol dehydrogenase n=1 Tax=Mycena alexandri TaxID=1745969 RepID=A0AAD6TAF4_9AGAR|nr:Aldehyde/histidinol dehydrogenase [Mycena alexandri]